MLKIVARTAVLMCLVAPAVATATDPLKTVGPDACIDCHSAEHDVWSESTHFRTYEELSLSDRAIEIAEALALDDIEAPDGTCVGCHFTLTGESLEDAEPIAGISCESCHGAAADWVDDHGLYPGDGPESESAEQRTERIARSEAAGQIRPERIDQIAANCLSCHTVPNEQLVNQGNHPAGSDFELVAWMEGEVRHNLFWSNGEENEPASIERKRVLYVLGQATDLEYSMRALALSQADGAYRKAMGARVTAAQGKLQQLASLVDVPAVGEIIGSLSGVDVAAPNAAALNAAADKVAQSIKALAGNDGTGLGAIDQLLPAEGRYSEKY